MWDKIDSLFNGFKTTALGAVLIYIGYWEQGMAEPNSALMYGAYLFGVLLVLSPKRVETLLVSLIKKFTKSE